MRYRDSLASRQFPYTLSNFVCCSEWGQSVMSPSNQSVNPYQSPRGPSNRRSYDQERKPIFHVLAAVVCWFFVVISTYVGLVELIILCAVLCKEVHNRGPTDSPGLILLSAVGALIVAALFFVAARAWSKRRNALAIVATCAAVILMEIRPSWPF